MLIYPSDVAMLGRDERVIRGAWRIARRLASAMRISPERSNRSRSKTASGDREEPTVTSQDFEPIDEVLTTLEAP